MFEIPLDVVQGVCLSRSECSIKNHLRNSLEQNSSVEPALDGLLEVASSKVEVWIAVRLHHEGLVILETKPLSKVLETHRPLLHLVTPGSCLSDNPTRISS